VEEEQKGDQMLLAACLKGSLTVKDLLDLGVSVNLMDEQGPA
jgi:hypothetical protein